MAKFCIYCGRELRDDEDCNCAASRSITFSPGSFYVNMKNRMGIGEPASNASDWYERGKYIVPDCVSPDEGEIPIRQYDVAILRTRLRLERAEGRMQVTNKRVLFRATGRSLMGRTAMQSEFAIDEIAGLSARKGYRFSLLDLLAGLFMLSCMIALFFALVDAMAYESRIFSAIVGLAAGIAGLIPFFVFPKHFYLKLLPLGASFGSLGALVSGGSAVAAFATPLAAISAIVCLFGLALVSIKPNLGIKIRLKSGHEAIEIERTHASGLFSRQRGNGTAEYTGSSEVLPMPETDVAIREICAIVSDIQKLGDFAIEKWQR